MNEARATQTHAFLFLFQLNMETNPVSIDDAYTHVLVFDDWSQCITFDLIMISKHLFQLHVSICLQIILHIYSLCEGQESVHEHNNCTCFTSQQTESNKKWEEAESTIVSRQTRLHFDRWVFVFFFAPVDQQSRRCLCACAYAYVYVLVRRVACSMLTMQMWRTSLVVFSFRLFLVRRASPTL